MGIKSEAAAGPDGISPLLLKIFCEELILPLQIIFSNSMAEGIFPEIWKKCYVTPVKKPGKSKSRAESFRPVALTCQMGKVMEIVIREIIQEHLELNNLLSRSQHGLRKILYITTVAIC